MFYLKLLFCFIGTCGFALMYNAPKRTVLAAGVIGTFGWLIYTIFSALNMPYVFCFFTAMLLISLLCEIGAIIFKTPSTVFLSVAILVLVPGLDIYKMVSFFVFGNYSAGSQIGIRAFLSVGAMAMAVAVGTFVTRIIKKIFAQE